MRQNLMQAHPHLYTGRHLLMGHRGESDLSDLITEGSLRPGSELNSGRHVSAAECAEKDDTDQSHPHPRPTSTPSVRGPAASHIPRLQSWVTVYRLQWR